MTALRKAAKKALEALDRSDYFGWQSNIPIIKSLREALAQPEPEPVAWAVYDIKHGGSKTLHWPEQHSPNGDPSQFKAVPLYSVPPQRKPLTEEQIKPIFDQWKILYGDYTIDLIRAIEQAHGIGREE